MVLSTDENDEETRRENVQTRTKRKLPQIYGNLTSPDPTKWNSWQATGL